MTIKFIETKLPGVMLVEPQVYKDPRGYFLETFNAAKYTQSSIPDKFLQDNHSHSERNTVRGLHYQLNQPQGKLIYVVSGEIYDVCVDIRHGSPHFGHWYGCLLSMANHRQMYVPEGFAHGFAVLSDSADVIYKCTRLYDAKDDRGILFNDPELRIDWPINKPLLSEKDRKNPTLAQLALENLPVYTP
jgi:dTDP-4-dehydrorhamnose 3,5-epimerase